jgi:dihydroorotate dehydrogenase (NAD+) catalytic subunit
MVWQVVNRVSIPVIGIGGIMDAKDALEFLILGAKAVQIGTANFINPYATLDVIDGIMQYLSENKIKSINEIIGTFKSA